MAIVLDAPSADQNAAAAPDESVAAGASELIESNAAEPFDPLDPDGEEERDPIITIKLRRAVEDTVVGYAALAGETLQAHIDGDGDVYLFHGPNNEHRIYMESGDFDLIEEAVNQAAGETKPPVDETKPEVSETKPEDPAPPIAATAAAPETAVTDATTTTTTTTTTPMPPVQHGSGTWPGAVVRADPTPAERYERERQEMEHGIASLMLRIAELKAETSRTKKAVDVATDELYELIESWKSGKYEEGLKAEAAGSVKPTMAPPSSPPPSTAPPIAATVDATLTTTTTTPGPSEAMDMTAKLIEEHRRQDRYNQVLEAAVIAELELPEKIEEKLVDAGAHNILKLARLIEDISLGREKWPKGVGQAKVTTIEKALQAWLARNASMWQVDPEPVLLPFVAGPAAATPETATVATEEVTVTKAPAITLPPSTPPPTIATPAAASVAMEDVTVEDL